MPGYIPERNANEKPRAAKGGDAGPSFREVTLRNTKPDGRNSIRGQANARV
jgi:hypothetical protein